MYIFIIRIITLSIFLNMQYCCHTKSFCICQACLTQHFSKHFTKFSLYRNQPFLYYIGAVKNIIFHYTDYKGNFIQSNTCITNKNLHIEECPHDTNRYHSSRYINITGDAFKQENDKYRQPAKCTYVYHNEVYTVHGFLKYKGQSINYLSHLFEDLERLWWLYYDYNVKYIKEYKIKEYKIKEYKIVSI